MTDKHEDIMGHFEELFAPPPGPSALEIAKDIFSPQIEELTKSPDLTTNNTELTVTDRRNLVITHVRERLLKFPDTTVSFLVKNPKKTTLSYRFKNDTDDLCEVECGTEFLRVKKTNKSWPTSMETIDINPIDYLYLNWSEGLIYRGDKNNKQSNNVMSEVEARIETFLPQLRTT